MEILATVPTVIVAFKSKISLLCSNRRYSVLAPLISFSVLVNERLELLLVSCFQVSNIVNQSLIEDQSF